MELWSIEELAVPAHEPRVLRSDRGAARGIALLLPAGERLQEHETHEHTWVVVISGEVSIAERRGGTVARTGSVAHFQPGERREIEARSDATLLLLLAPWPGEGHPGASDALS